MDYQVPQFIEIENKVVGPLTIRQFIYVAGGAGICLASFFYLPVLLAVIVSAPVAALAGALAFYKVNGKPFINVLESGFNFYTGRKLFLWRREEPKPQTAAAQPRKPVTPEHSAPRLTRGKLSELAWSLDIKGTDPANRTRI